MAFEFTDVNFEEKALGDTVAVVDFWAEWCGPCRMIGPIIDDLASSYDESKVLIGKVNVDNNPETSLKYGVRSIPTILIIKGGEVVDKVVGVTTKTKLKELIDAQLN